MCMVLVFADIVYAYSFFGIVTFRDVYPFILCMYIYKIVAMVLNIIIRESLG